MGERDLLFSLRTALTAGGSGHAGRNNWRGADGILVGRTKDLGYLRQSKEVHSIGSH